MPYKNPADKLAYMLVYSQKHKARENARSRKWYQDNKEYALVQSKEYNAIHPEVHQKAAETYRAKKIVEIGEDALRQHQSKIASTWQKNNPEKVKRIRANYHKVHSDNDPAYVIKTRLRARLNKKLKACGGIKSASSLALTGCTSDFLRGYLESRFEPGMTWNNINIDHRIPCAAFDLTDPEQQRQCFHYSNLCPMWAAENVKKGSKRPPTHQAELL